LARCFFETHETANEIIEVTQAHPTQARAKGFRPVSLDALSLLGADVRGALGRYLNVFLVTQQHWTQSQVGLVTTVGGVLGLAVQTRGGALIDSTRARRGLVVAALAVLAGGRRSSRPL
jgi:hypothetical protein